MKPEKIIRDGKFVGLKKVFEPGDTYGEQFGEFVVLDKEPTVEDYENLINIVLQQMFDYIKDSGKVWTCEGLKVILKTKEDFLDGLLPDNKIGTLGVKVEISRIVEEGETID